MKGKRPPDQPKRVVTPRKRKHTHRPIIALTDTELFMESGQLLSADQLLPILLTEPSSIIVCQGFGVHLDKLRKHFGKDKTFQYRVTPKTTLPRNDNGEKPKPVRIADALVNFVGFQGYDKNVGGGKRWTRYHYPIDPVHFVRASIDELYPERETRLHKLLRFAQELREFCECQLLEVKPSAGGLAGQLLRDPRFYPEPRRKVPQLINDGSRSQLPGNYYHLHADKSPKAYNAIYLDLSNAHHEIAKTLAFPDSNDLYAFGYWGNSDPDKPFVDLSRGKLSTLLSRPGLFRVRISVPHIPLRRFPPPCMSRAGAHTVWLFSNELELVEELGGEIQAIYTAYVSQNVDQGLNRYAEWSIEQIAAHPDYKPWLKPTLHATYGILAARAIPFETGYYRARAGEKKEYPLGRVWVPVKALSSSKAVESRITNVIHRGMIEAEVRLKVLSLARELSDNGYNVLSVYADSVFIEGDKPPLLPPPWRVSDFCTNLRFLSSTHFVSDQCSRLPGVPRQLRNDPPTPSQALRSLPGKPGDSGSLNQRWNPVGRFQISTGSDTIGS